MINLNNQMIEMQSNNDYKINNVISDRPISTQSGAADPTMKKYPTAHSYGFHTSNQSTHYGGMEGTSTAKENAKMVDILDYSPFNFYHGINPKRLMRGKCMLSKPHLN